MSEVPELLHALLCAAAPTGSEQAATAVFTQALSGVAELRQDALGSSLARLPGTGEGPVTAIFTHIDEIGLIVKAIDDQGFLLVEELGSWDAQILVGQRYEVLTGAGAIPGVVGRKPVHTFGKDDAQRVAPTKDLRVDIGARDRADAASRVSVGDAMVIAAAPVVLPHGRIVSRALDNRVSVYAAAEVLRRLAADPRPHGEVVVVASVQEETTAAGAIAAAFAIEPDRALVIDVTQASDAPGMSIDVGGEHPFGSGPAIVRGPGANPGVAVALRAAAERAQIPYTIEAMGGRTMTDADGVHHSRRGVPTGIIGIPLRYMHSPVEMVQLSDVEHTIALTVEFLVHAANA